jgi:hypothetical protein
MEYESYELVQMADAERSRGHGRDDRQDKKRQKYKCDSDYVLKKRLPPRLPRRNNDIYITNKSNYQVCIFIYNTFSNREPQYLHYD